MVKRFKTKPVEVEAIQFTGDNFDVIRRWTGHHIAKSGDKWAIPNFCPIGTYVLETPEMIAEGIKAEVWDKLHYSWIGVKPGQWIVRGAKGEFYPCDDETFHWKYEEVENGEV